MGTHRQVSGNSTTDHNLRIVAGPAAKPSLILEGVAYPERCASFVSGANGEADVHMWSSIHGDWARIELSEPGAQVDQAASEYGSEAFRDAIELSYQGVATQEQLLGRLAEMASFREA